MPVVEFKVSLMIIYIYDKKVIIDKKGFVISQRQKIT